MSTAQLGQCQGLLSRTEQPRGGFGRMLGTEAVCQFQYVGQPRLRTRAGGKLELPAVAGRIHRRLATFLPPWLRQLLGAEAAELASLPWSDLKSRG
jgi:hypothetical protein